MERLPREDHLVHVVVQAAHCAPDEARERPFQLAGHHTPRIEPGRVDRQRIWRGGLARPRLEDDEFGDVISRTIPGISSGGRI